MPDQLTYPVRDIRSVLRACRTNEPLEPDDPRRYDFTRLRGGDVLTELAERLEQELEAGGFHRGILCGHIGSGKTTELLCLRRWADREGFLTVWVDAETHFGLMELQFQDLYLLVAERVAAAMEDEQASLPAKKLERVVQWFADVTEENLQEVKTELKAEVGAEIGSSFSLLLAKLFAKFSAGVKAGSERHRKTRLKLRESPNTLIDLTNDLLTTANRQLGEGGRDRGLLLIFDTLDHYDRETISRLLETGAPYVSQLACHCLFTMPIDLFYAPDSPIQDAYGPPVILPMLALRKGTDPWLKTAAASAFDAGAVQEMLAALRQRLDLDALFERPEDARLLVKMSGGCLRDLLHLVNLARQKSRVSLNQAAAHMTSAGVARAIDEYRLTLTEGLQEGDYSLLAAIARRAPEAHGISESVRRLLKRRVAFRYSNGKDRWTDVNPLVIETEGFQRAFASSSALTTG